jgi:hypothetical protein
MIFVRLTLKLMPLIGSLSIIGGFITSVLYLTENGEDHYISDVKSNIINKYLIKFINETITLYHNTFNNSIYLYTKLLSITPIIYYSSYLLKKFIEDNK